jgi:uncharacterized protein involved in tellurium resistance
LTFLVALAKAVRNKAFEKFGSSRVENEIQVRRLKRDGNSSSATAIHIAERQFIKRKGNSSTNKFIESNYYD